MRINLWGVVAHKVVVEQRVPMQKSLLKPKAKDVQVWHVISSGMHRTWSKRYFIMALHVYVIVYNV